MEFYAGSVHTARAVMHNPTSEAFDYIGVLYMGTNQVVFDEVPFQLNAGESKEISFSVTMPASVGEYPVYLSVFSGAVLLAHYQATENVVIVSAALSEFYMPASARKSMTATIEPYTVCHTWIDVTNNGDADGVQVVHIWDTVGNVDVFITVALGPGETYTWYRSQWIDFNKLPTYVVRAQGDWVGNDSSVANFP